jgi:hypothetical protein
MVVLEFMSHQRPRHAAFAATAPRYRSPHPRFTFQVGPKAARFKHAELVCIFCFFVVLSFFGTLKKKGASFDRPAKRPFQCSAPRWPKRLPPPQRV